MPTVPGDVLDVRRRSEEHTSELQSLRHLVCRLLLPRPPNSTLFPYTTLSDLCNSTSLRANRNRKNMFKHASVGASALSILADTPLKGYHAAKTLKSVEGCRCLLSRAMFLMCGGDRKSTRLNSSHLGISYAVFCYPVHLTLHSFPTRRSPIYAIPRAYARIEIEKICSNTRLLAHPLYQFWLTPL